MVTGTRLEWWKKYIFVLVHLTLPLSSAWQWLFCPVWCHWPTSINVFSIGMLAGDSNFSFRKEKRERERKTRKAEGRQKSSPWRRPLKTYWCLSLSASLHFPEGETCWLPVECWRQCLLCFLAWSFPSRKPAGFALSVLSSWCLHAWVVSPELVSGVLFCCGGEHLRLVLDSENLGFVAWCLFFLVLMDSFKLSLLFPVVSSGMPITWVIWRSFVTLECILLYPLFFILFQF